MDSSCTLRVEICRSDFPKTLYLIYVIFFKRRLYISHFDSFSYFKHYLKIAVLIFHSEAGNRYLNSFAP